MTDKLSSGCRRESRKLGSSFKMYAFGRTKEEARADLETLKKRAEEGLKNKLPQEVPVPPTKSTRGITASWHNKPKSNYYSDPKITEEEFERRKNLPDGLQHMIFVERELDAELSAASRPSVAPTPDPVHVSQALLVLAPELEVPLLFPKIKKKSPAKKETGLMSDCTPTQLDKYSEEEEVTFLEAMPKVSPSQASICDLQEKRKFEFVEISIPIPLLRSNCYHF